MDVTHGFRNTGKHRWSSVAALAILTLMTASGLLSAEEVTVASIRAATEDCVRRAFSGMGEVVVECGDVSSLGDLQSRNLEIRPRLMGTRDTRGPVVVSLEFWEDGARVAQRAVSARVEVHREVLVAAERLDRHSSIEPGSTRLERRDVRTLGDRFFTSTVDLTGSRTRRIIPEGGVVLASDVEAIPVIDRGQRIVLVVDFGGIIVSATARALEQGVEGDEIEVKNDRSGKRLRGVVVGDGVVRIEVSPYLTPGG